MLRTLPQTRDYTLAQRLLGIAVFTVFTVLSARVSFGSPVPFTLQVLTVLLAGMVLGSRDGALSQLAYLGLIALNLPVDAYSRGAAALVGPTAGYLIAFVPAAWVAGFLVEHGATRFWQRWLAGIAGIAIIYALGFTVFSVVRADMGAAWTLTVQPFIAFDIVKAVVAAALAESGRTLLLRNLPHQ